ncbi:MAG: c-type cytochrome [Burkholderiaceae bacterium]
MTMTIGASAMAADGLSLAKSKNCLACHAVETKIVGPAYKEIAKKYKSDKTAEAKLITKIQKGGVGAWGQIPMPAQPQVSPEEAKQLAKWILSL